ncbi:nuclear transport factor 2 family protein [Gaopeijia maritima]|uniref:Nuclear transport factor 2 family protein n=1 Tax=Gaopeijia maritima TaxID=3119007 RepID=A0ABU9EEB9_9BACT
MDQLIREMVRQASAERAVIELFVATDRRDWHRVRRLLADTVALDLSTAGGPQGAIAADDVVDSWRSGLARLDAVHHQVGNLRTTIHGDDAHVACHGIVIHHRRTVTGRDTRTFVGTYDLGLLDSPRGWHVHTFRFQLRFTDGNPGLLD